MKKNKYIDFDVTKFLNEYNISYSEGVKNVGTGWVGLDTCPFCEATGYHFAINTEHKGGNCWVCGATCNPLGLIKKTLNVPIHEAYNIIGKFCNDIVDYVDRKPSKEVMFPSGMNDIDIIGINYLRRRNYNHVQIIKDYGIKQTGAVSNLVTEGSQQNFKQRIIVPIIMNHEVVSYTARDMTDKSDKRYLNPVIEAVQISPASAIYNIDTVKDKCIIVEGVTDVWRMGKETISLQGVKHTAAQVCFLAEKRLKQIYVMYDINAEKEALKLANSLSGVTGSVDIVALNTASDPGELSDFEALKIKHQLLGG